MTARYAQHPRPHRPRRLRALLRASGSTPPASSSTTTPTPLTADAEWVKHNLVPDPRQPPQRLLRAATPAGLPAPQRLPHLPRLPDHPRVPRRPPPPGRHQPQAHRPRRRQRPVPPRRQPPPRAGQPRPHHPRPRSTPRRQRARRWLTTPGFSSTPPKIATEPAWSECSRFSDASTAYGTPITFVAVAAAASVVKAALPRADRAPRYLRCRSAPPTPPTPPVPASCNACLRRVATTQDRSAQRRAPLVPRGQRPPSLPARTIARRATPGHSNNTTAGNDHARRRE